MVTADSAPSNYLLGRQPGWLPRPTPAGVVFVGVWTPPHRFCILGSLIMLQAQQLGGRIGHSRKAAPPALAARTALARHTLHTNVDQVARVARLGRRVPERQRRADLAAPPHAASASADGFAEADASQPDTLVASTFALTKVILGAGVLLRSVGAVAAVDHALGCWVQLLNSQHSACHVASLLWCSIQPWWPSGQPPALHTWLTDAELLPCLSMLLGAGMTAIPRAYFQMGILAGTAMIVAGKRLHAMGHASQGCACVVCSNCSCLECVVRLLQWVR